MYTNLQSSFRITHKRPFPEFLPFCNCTSNQIHKCLNSKWLLAQTRWFEHNNNGILAGVGDKYTLIRAGHQEIDVETVERFSHLFVSLPFSPFSSSQHPLCNHSKVKIFISNENQEAGITSYCFFLLFFFLSSCAIFNHFSMKSTAVWPQWYSYSGMLADEMEKKNKEKGKELTGASWLLFWHAKNKYKRKTIDNL